MSDRGHKFNDIVRGIDYIAGHAKCVKCEVEAWIIFTLLDRKVQDEISYLYKENNLKKCYPRDLELMSKHHPCLTDEEVIIKKLLE